MCLKAVSTDLKANFCEPWLVVFHRNWSRRAEIVAEQQKSPHRKKVGVDGWVNTAFDGQDHCTISTVRLFTRPWSYLQYSDKRYDWTGSYITPFYSNTFYSAPHSPPIGDVGFSIVPTDALTRRLEQQRFDPPSVCSHPEHTRMWELSRNLCVV